jgi:exosortase/archaeosortase family protein
MVASIFSKPYVNFNNPQGPVIGLNHFYMAIYKSCSGIESFSVFTFLFMAVVSFNWKRINRKSVPFLFVLGIIGTFFLNVTRLAALLITGAYFSREISVDIFHTNMGWILMLGYFAIFNEGTVRFFCRREKDAG